MPYIVDGDKKIGDSNFIIDYLKQTYGDPLNAHLTASDRAISLAMPRPIDITRSLKSANDGNRISEIR